MVLPASRSGDGGRNSSSARRLTRRCLNSRDPSETGRDLVRHCGQSVIQGMSCYANVNSRRRVPLGEGSRPASIPSVLGRIAHTALELLARRSPTPLVERPSPAAVGRICDEAWDEAEQFESQKREVAALIEGSGKPPTWNQYHEQKLFLVRLFHVTAEWLVSIDAQKGDLLPEQELTSPEGDIYGKLDLHVRGPIGAVLDCTKDGQCTNGRATETRYQGTAATLCVVGSTGGGKWPVAQVGLLWLLEEEPSLIGKLLET